MRQFQNSPNKMHQDVQLLLPWYVNNTLKTDEKGLVESHLKVCLQCREQMVELREISHHVAYDVDPLSVKALLSFSELSERIHESKLAIPDQTKKTFTLADFKCPRIGSNKKKSFSGYAVFVQAATVLIVITGMIHFNELDSAKNQNNQFYTLSSSNNVALMKNEIRVVFSKTVNKIQIDQTLLSVDGKIISGPSQQGVYVIRINDINVSGREITELVAKLRAQSHIVFAEPALSALLQNQSG